MDNRLCTFLASQSGSPVDSWPQHGIDVRVSSQRTDMVRNRLLALSLRNSGGALVTGIERVVEAIRPIIEELSIAELFSPVGTDALRYAMSPGDAQSVIKEPDFVCAISSRESFRPTHATPNPVPLTGAEVTDAAHHLGITIPETDASTCSGLPQAFACRSSQEWVSIATIRWQDSRVAEISDVETKESHRRKGFGIAAVSAATDYILLQDRVAIYGTWQSNVPAWRMIHKLGFRLSHQIIYG